MPSASARQADDRPRDTLSPVQSEARAELERHFAAGGINGLEIFPGISDTCLRLDGWLPSHQLDRLAAVKAAVTEQFDALGLTVVYRVESDCGGWAQISAI